MYLFFPFNWKVGSCMPDDALNLLLALCSEITPLWAQEVISSVGGIELA